MKTDWLYRLFHPFTWQEFEREWNEGLKMEGKCEVRAYEKNGRLAYGVRQWQMGYGDAGLTGVRPTNILFVSFRTEKAAKKYAEELERATFAAKEYNKNKPV